MDIAKIREHVRKAETIIEELDGADDDHAADRWRAIQRELANARALVDHARVRNEDQTFIRELIVYRLDALDAEATEAAR